MREEAPSLNANRYMRDPRENANFNHPQNQPFQTRRFFKYKIAEVKSALFTGQAQSLLYYGFKFSAIACAIMILLTDDIPMWRKGH